MTYLPPRPRRPDFGGPREARNSSTGNRHCRDLHLQVKGNGLVVCDGGGDGEGDSDALG